MSKHVEELVDKLSYIQSSSKSMEDSGLATLNSMESISAILEETSAASTSVAEIVDMQNEALVDLDKAANLLMDRATELDGAIKQFKTK
jgi:methyl-accepting chemotaxis protein